MYGRYILPLIIFEYKNSGTNFWPKSGIEPGTQSAAVASKCTPLPICATDVVKFTYSYSEPRKLTQIRFVLIILCSRTTQTYSYQRPVPLFSFLCTL